MMPLVLLAATTFGFANQAGATTTPNQVLQYQSQQIPHQFSPGNKNIISIPSSAAKIRSPPSSKSSTSLDASPQVTVESVSTAQPNNIEDAKSPSPRGEHESNILSRLLYNYASQLLDISSKRQIEITDALPVPKHITMIEQVPALEGIYKKCKAKAHKQLETLKSSSSIIATASDGDDTKGKKNRLKQNINERIAKSESLILAKSLLLHQKKNLMITGVLRLSNTLIQAFPAILVSRLLKLIESGDMHHPSKAVIAACQLIALLSVKMVIENLYFHNVVKCATMVRGSLTGLIFDKSLRLSSSSATGSRNSNADDKDDAKNNDVDKKKNDKQKERGSLGTGGVLNLMQTDISVIESMALQIHTIWGKKLNYEKLCFYL